MGVIGYNFREGARLGGTRRRLQCGGGQEVGADRSGFEAEGELFDDGVGEDLAGDALDLDLGRGGIGGQLVGEGKLEVLSLADIGDAFVFHAAERAGYGLALGVEDGPLQCYVHMRLHEV